MNININTNDLLITTLIMIILITNYVYWKLLIFIYKILLIVFY